MTARFRIGRVLLYVLVAGLSVVVASVVYAPASLAAWLVSSGTGGRIVIDQASGSFWAGEGDLLVHTGSGALRIPNFSWTILANRIWRGELAAAIHAAGPDIAGSVEVARGLHGFSLRNTKVDAPVGLFFRGIPALDPFRPSGRLTFSAAAISLNPPAVNGSADLLIEDAQANRLGSLGDYRVALQGAQEGATLNITTLRGPLHIVGSGDLTLTGDVRFRGEASVEPSERERFAPVLSFIGIPRPDGSVPLQWPLSGPIDAHEQPIMSGGSNAPRNPT